MESPSLTKNNLCHQLNDILWMSFRYCVQQSSVLDNFIENKVIKYFKEIEQLDIKDRYKVNATFDYKDYGDSNLDTVLESVISEFNNNPNLGNALKFTIVTARRYADRRSTYASPMFNDSYDWLRKEYANLSIDVDSDSSISYFPYAQDGAYYSGNRDFNALRAPRGGYRPFVTLNFKKEGDSVSPF